LPIDPGFVAVARHIVEGAAIAEIVVWVWRTPGPGSVEIAYRAAFYPVVTIER